MAQLTPSTKKTVCVSNFFPILAKQQVGLKEARSSVRNWPSFYTSWLPLWVDTHIRTFLCTVSSRHVLDHVKTTYEEVYRYIWQTPQVQRQTCTLSLRYKFIRSRCRQFHVLGLKNEEYSTKMVFLFTRKLFLKWSYFLCSLLQFHCLSLYRKDWFLVREAGKSVTSCPIPCPLEHLNLPPVWKLHK